MLRILKEWVIMDMVNILCLAAQTAFHILKGFAEGVATVLALGIAHSTEAAQAQRQVTDITKSLLKQNAEKLHLASVETAKEAERGIVDIQTLKQTNAQLIRTLDDVMKIQADGRAKRLAAEVEMAKMENELKVKLLELRNKN